MNKTDFEDFKRLEDLLNRRAISPTDFWQRIRELKTISSSTISKIQRELYTLEAKSYTEHFDPSQEPKYNFSKDIFIKNKMESVASSQVPLIHTTHSPEGLSHHIEPRTSGEIMLHKLGYAESVSERVLMISGNRTFERVRDRVIDYIVFSKTDNEIHFTSYLTRKTHALHKNPDEPKTTTKKELEAIIQIITEWMD